MAWAMRARLGLATASALALVIAAGVVHIIAAERSIEEIETAVARRVSAIRVEHMRPPLRTDPDLVRIAREYSCALLERGALSHQDPAGKTVGDRVLAAGKQYRAVGENLASSSGAGDPVAAAIGAWMRSTGHRENILQPEFVETGVGACRSGQTYYFTQIFLRPAPSRR
jgi:uncharacterized protein YkwD